MRGEERRGNEREREREEISEANKQTIQPSTYHLLYKGAQ